MRATFCDLSPRVKLRLMGGDALRFLNGQISNDLRKIAQDSSIQASILNAKGRLNANVYISTDADSFMLDADPEVREELPVRIERYIIADDVQFEDVTDRFAIFHVTGEARPSISPPARTVRAARFGSSGWDLWLENSERDGAFDQLSSDLDFCDEKCTELLRIEQGIPRWGRELTDQIIPIEANLDATSIDYAKGCYIGQEVISRMKTSGQTNKRLCGLVSLSGAPLQAGMRLMPEGEEGKEVGWITSAVHSPRLNQEIALGYLKRGFYTVGLHFRALLLEAPANKVSVPVQVVNIPFL